MLTTNTKLKVKTVKQMLNDDLTKTELQLILYLALRQDKSGRIKGIYYKDVCLDLNIVKQSFYNALYGLQNKGYIIIDCNYKYWNIIINDNFYEDKNKTSHQYVNINRKILGKLDLKAGELKLILYLLLQKRINEGKKFNIYIETISDKIKIKTKTTILRYIERLKSINIFTEIKYKNKGKISLISDVYNLEEKKETDTDSYLKHIIKYYCNKYKINYTLRDIKDIIKLIKQYKYDNKLKLTIIDISLKQRQLQPALIHYVYRA